jgi:uncharacterized protein YjbI with pentapeptide repeats
METEFLTDTFIEQLTAGPVADAIATTLALPPLHTPRDQPVRIARCILRNITASDPNARRLHLQDVRIESSDLANLNLSGGLLERVEITSTRLTGTIYTEAQLKSVLFKECKLDLALWRMARLQQCVFERCNLAEADFYGADLSGAVFRDCDLSRADITNAKLVGADLRDCRLDGLRGTPADMKGLIISPDQAPQLITLFGVNVKW